MGTYTSSAGDEFHFKLIDAVDAENEGFINAHNAQTDGLEPFNIIVETHRGFRDALFTAYGMDINTPLGDICIITHLNTQVPFSLDTEARRKSIEELTRAIFRDNGLLVIRPKNGMWVEEIVKTPIAYDTNRKHTPTEWLEIKRRRVRGYAITSSNALASVAFYKKGVGRGLISGEGSTFIHHTKKHQTHAG